MHWRVPLSWLAVLCLARLQPSQAELGGAMCHKLGLRGECEVQQDCMCLCFHVTADNSTLVDAAYFGELGYELILFTPLVHFYHSRGILRSTVGPAGSAPFYRFSPHHREVDVQRHYCLGPYSNPSPHMYRREWNFDAWIPPNLHEQYKGQGQAILGDGKPLMIVHNKYNQEWGAAPTNFISISTLIALFSMLKDRYRIVYIRPDPRQNLPGFGADHNHAEDFDDHEHLRKHHPKVLLFQDILQQQRNGTRPDLNYNELQLMLHADSERFVSVLGGNSVIASYFAGVNIIYAVKGSELTGHGLKDREFDLVYPRLGPNGKGTILTVSTTQHLLQAAANEFLQQQGDTEAGRTVLEASHRTHKPHRS
ncbi:hypothetical protein WJX73_001439 [Symbiochloris irregularis]|uniref:Uncharacterized protein n=1 Tax=Symbiochloris irregularis TaxID=706552 RepID=A0AAW1P7J1_9CHLO